MSADFLNRFCNTRILLVEPHPDDAMLNCGYFLRNVRAEVSLVSVFRGHNKENSQAMLKYFGSVKYYFQQRYPDYDWFRRSRDLSLSREALFKIYSENYDMTHIYKFLFNLSINYDFIFLPMGVSHPAHLLISFFDSPVTAVYYKEFPYSNVKRIRHRVDAFATNRIEVWDSKGCDFFDKALLFRKLYPTQWFYSNRDINAFEEKFYMDVV